MEIPVTRVVNILEVASVCAEGFGIGFEHIRSEILLDTQGEMSNKQLNHRVRFKGRFQDWKYGIWESSTYREHLSRAIRELM